MKKNNVKKFVDQETITNQEFDLICQIVKIRNDAKFSQKDLEVRTGISQPNIARFEKNTHTATLATTLKILNAMGYKLKIVKNK